MADALNDIIVKVSAIVSQTLDVVNTSDEYSLWKLYINMAQREWAETYDWQSLYREYNTLTTTAGTDANGTTIALPSDFRKLAGFPKIMADGETTNEYGQIDPQKKEMMASDEHYCYILNNGSSNYLFANGTIVSGASIFISYWKSPASLVSPADVVDCPNPDYLVQRTIAYIWESREDSRFPEAKAEADKILARLLENENTQGYAYDQTILTPEKKSFSFRIGRN